MRMKSAISIVAVDIICVLFLIFSLVSEGMIGKVFI